MISKQKGVKTVEHRKGGNEKGELHSIEQWFLKWGSRTPEERIDTWGIRFLKNIKY